MGKSSNTITFPTGPIPESYMTADTGHVLIAVGSTFLALEILALGLRTVSRHIKGVPFGLDDALIIPALVFNLLVCSLAIVAVPYAGAGRHTLAVLKENPRKIRFLGIDALMVMPISYSLAVAFSKGAILAIFLRLFRMGVTRKVTYATAAVVAIHTIVTVFVIIFQCHPISDLWDKTIRENCISTQKFFAYTSLPNILTDFVMLFMPTVEIWRLQMTTRMKVGVTLTLLTASVGIITSIVRFVRYFESDIFGDPAWQSTELMSLAVAEPGTYFLAACLPSYRSLIRYLSTVFQSMINKGFHLKQRLDSTSGSVEAGASGGNEIRNDMTKESSAKHVRAFDSILLSEISADRSMLDHQRSY